MSEISPTKWLDNCWILFTYKLSIKLNSLELSRPLDLVNNLSKRGCDIDIPQKKLRASVKTVQNEAEEVDKIVTDAINIVLLLKFPC